MMLATKVEPQQHTQLLLESGIRQLLSPQLAREPGLVVLLRLWFSPCVAGKQCSLIGLQGAWPQKVSGESTVAFYGSARWSNRSTCLGE